MWSLWSKPTRDLQEALEYNGETPHPETPYKQTNDEPNTLNKPLVSVITKQPTTSAKTATYTPPSDISSTKPKKEESPFSPFYSFWGHS
jgi:hypothetical protein